MTQREGVVQEKEATHKRYMECKRRAKERKNVHSRHGKNIQVSRKGRMT